MAIKKIARLWYYYYKNKDGKIVTVPLKTDDRNEALKRAKVIEEQRNGAKMLANTQTAYEDSYLRSLPEQAFERLSILGKQQQMSDLQVQMIQFQNSQIASMMKMQNIPTIEMSSAQVLQSQNALVIDETVNHCLQPTTVKTTIQNTVKTTFDEMYTISQRYRKSLNKNHRNAWNAFKEWCMMRGIEYVQDVTPRIAQLYMTDVYGDTKSKTYNTTKGCINVVFKAGLIEAGMEASPFALVQHKQLDDVEHFRDFTLEECEKIIHTACPYWKVLCMIALYTGLRQESCRRLSPSHVKDFCITILPGKTARFHRKVFIPLMPELREFLENITPFNETDEKPYCEHFEKKRQWPLSMNKHGDKARHLYFSGMLKYLDIEDTDSEKADFPSFRCTFVTLLSKNGIRKDVIKGIVGHTSDDMTELYNHDTDSARKSILSMPSLGIK